MESQLFLDPLHITEPDSISRIVIIYTAKNYREFENAMPYPMLFYVSPPSNGRDFKDEMIVNGTLPDVIDCLLQENKFFGVYLENSLVHVSSNFNAKIQPYLENYNNGSVKTIPHKTYLDPLMDKSNFKKTALALFDVSTVDALNNVLYNLIGYETNLDTVISTIFKN